jgi:hypothetical protein
MRGALQQSLKLEVARSSSVNVAKEGPPCQQLRMESLICAREVNNCLMFINREFRVKAEAGQRVWEVVVLAGDIRPR